MNDAIALTIGQYGHQAPGDLFVQCQLHRQIPSHLHDGEFVRDVLHVVGDDGSVSA